MLMDTKINKTSVGLRFVILQKKDFSFQVT